MLSSAVCAASAQQRFDVTPLFGYGSSISFPFVVTERAYSGTARVASGESFGVAAGTRFDESQVVEFRYLRQSSNMQIAASAAPFSAHAVIEHYLGDFTHEFLMANSPGVRPFVAASLGMARIAAAAQSFNRFSFAVGAGVKWFPTRRVGLRVQAEWLPIWTNPEVKGFICGGGCAVALGGTLASQGQVSLGPIFSF
jgi:hypothetical protein